MNYYGTEQEVPISTVVKEPEETPRDTLEIEYGYRWHIDSCNN